MQVSGNFMTTTTFINNPKEIEDSTIDKIIDLIVSGGQMERIGLKEKLLNAVFIAYMLNDDGQLICTATLKNPFGSYRTKVYKLSKSLVAPQDEKEIGYIVTNSNFENQGHCSRLLTKFFQTIPSLKLYATTRKPAMVNILSKFNFKQTGQIYNNDLILLINY